MTVAYHLRFSLTYSRIQKFGHLLVMKTLNLNYKSRHIASFNLVVSLLLFGIVTVGCSGKIKELEATSQRHEKEINDIRSLSAEHSVTLEQLRNDIRRISGLVEELEYQARGKTEEIRKVLEQVSSRVPPPPGVPEELLVEDEESLSSNNSQAAQQFKDGLKQIRAGDFNGAVSTFTAFVQANGNTIVTDNALVWVGVAQEKLGQYDRAVVAYSEVFTRFPGEDRAPWALLFLANSFEKLNQREESKITLQKVVDDYGTSAAARKAEERLKVDYGVKVVSKKPGKK